MLALNNWQHYVTGPGQYLVPRHLHATITSIVKPKASCGVVVWAKQRRDHGGEVYVWCLDSGYRSTAVPSETIE